VCPVLEPGQKSRRVYLPTGTWYNFWTLEVIEGGKEVEVQTPLETIPVFIKAGAVIPEYPIQQYVGEKEIEEVKLNVYFAEHDVNSFFFEDYGETFAYEQDIYSEKKFVTSGNKTGMSIQQSLEGLYTPRYEMYIFTVSGLPFKPKTVTADGKAITNFTINADGLLEFRYTKNFKKIDIAAK